MKSHPSPLIYGHPNRIPSLTYHSMSIVIILHSLMRTCAPASGAIPIPLQKQTTTTSTLPLTITHPAATGVRRPPIPISIHQLPKPTAVPLVTVTLTPPWAIKQPLLSTTIPYQLPTRMPTMALALTLSISLPTSGVRLAWR